MSERPNIPKRHFLVAWFVGCIFYVFLAGDIVADVGMIAVPFQLVCAAIFSITFVGIARLVGLVFRISPICRIWYSSSVPSVAVIVVAIAIVIFGRSVGMTATVMSKSGTPYETLNPWAGFGAMLAAVFATLHFSIRRLTTQHP